MQLPSVLALGALISIALAHGNHQPLGYHELGRRAAISKRCASAVGEMNEKRSLRYKEKRTLHARHQALKLKGLQSRANTTSVVITTEAPYFDTLQNDTCVLTPEVTSGPYVWPRSETLRQDMSEDQGGVPLYLDIGVMDTTTCSPLQDVLVDLWHCNATGSYSSFDALSPDIPFEQLLASKNLTIGPGLDLHTGNSTFLRGMWPTDANGMMEMKTVFPGFYVERAIHIHAQVHTNWAVGINGTLVSDNTVATGQMFFDEETSQKIMALEPYASHNTINRTTNDVDMVWAQEDIDGYYPLMQVTPLDGVDITNGMVAYLTLGVDPTNTNGTGAPPPPSRRKML